jgi:tRNA (mo5U34)-methyltransferase
MDDQVATALGQEWWHTIELAPGVVTPGGWDLRPTAERVPWPAAVRGGRCLDLGTMDGRWAFELERRGASEVVASDLPGSIGRARFELAASVLGSRVSYAELDVLDLDPEEIGQFDVIFVGYVLQLVRDPLGALDRIRSVCRGHVIIVETVSAPLSILPAPLARLDARRDGRERFVFNRAGLRKALVLAGFEISSVSGLVRDRPGELVGRHGIGPRRMLHLAGLRGVSVIAVATGVTGITPTS